MDKKKPAMTRDMASLQEQIALLEQKIKQTEEALKMTERRFEIAMDYSDVTLFDYDVVTGQMMFSISDMADYNLPPVIDNAISALIESGFVQPNSVPDFRLLYQRIHEGAAFSQAAICIKNNTGELKTFELSLTSVFDSDHRPVRAVGVKKDITESLLLQREQEYGSTLAENKILAYEANVTSNLVIKYNTEWARDIGVSDIHKFSDLITTMSETVIAVEHKEMFVQKSSVKAILSSYEKGRRLISMEYRRKSNGYDYHWFEKTVNIVKDEMTGDINIRCYMVNIDDKKEKENRALAEQRHYEAMLAKSVTIYEVNLSKNSFISGHENWNELFGIKQTDNYSDLLESFARKALYPDDKEVFNACFLRENVLNAYDRNQKELICEYRRSDSSNDFIWVRCTMHLFEDPKTNEIKGFTYVEDIHTDKKKELELIYKSQHDLLTGFFNKTTAQERVDAFLSTSSAKIANHAFIMIDLDFFKSINDNFGHAFGDALLSQVADKIKALFRDDDILGRVGGDEFIVLMKYIQSKKQVDDKAQKICEQLCEVYTQNGLEYAISASIGIAYYYQHGKLFDSLYRHSDIALYHSKTHGRNQFAAYADEMNVAATSVKEIEQGRLVETKKFEDNMMEFIFRILYESGDKEAAINAVLALIGKKYNVSRAYVFESADDGLFTSNTFEWCNEGVIPQISMLQNISYESLDNYIENFNEEGIFYMPDIDKASSNIQKILEPQAVKSMLQFSILKSGKFVGFIGLDQCGFTRTPSPKELSDIRNIANILGVFIMEMRSLKANEMSKDMAMSIVNGLDSYAYVCDPQTHEVLFVNEKTLQIQPTAKVGDRCYEAFWNRDSECVQCPMKTLFGINEMKYSMDMYNPNLKIWIKATASRINWFDGKKVCLVDSVDITEYKQNIKG